MGGIFFYKYFVPTEQFGPEERQLKNKGRPLLFHEKSLIEKFLQKSDIN
jgi:hypothetical protein